MLKGEQRNCFIEENLALVRSLSMRFSGRGIENEDLFGAGCIGLCKAADNFNPELGYCFSTYAVPVILGEIKRLFRDGGSIKVSRSVKELYLKTVKIKAELSEKFNREPSVNEIAQVLNVSAEEVTNAVCAARIPVSLSVGEDEKKNEIPFFDNTDSLFDKITVDNAVKTLKNDEKIIIKLRYYKGLTQSETAKILGLTQVNISRSERKILEKLKKEIGSAS